MSLQTHPNLLLKSFGALVDNSYNDGDSNDLPSETSDAVLVLEKRIAKLISTFSLRQSSANITETAIFNVSSSRISSL